MVAACLACACAPGFAAAKPKPAPPTSGGATPAPAGPAPPVTRIDCMRSCAAGRAPRTGSLLRVRGKALRQTAEVVFRGADGPADDVTALTGVRRPSSVDVRVPLGAASGPVQLVDRSGAESPPTALPLLLGPPPAGGPPVELAVRAPRAFYDSAQPPGVTYVVHGSAPAAVTVDLVRVPDGFPIAHWDATGVPPDVPQRVSWDGTMGGKVQPAGRYAFRVTLAGPNAGAAQAAPDAAFDFARDRFPILGPHTFGTGAAAFGGPRGHQGQDTFAACGTPLVAAHGGVVKYAGYHARAGYYLVIDNAGASTDYVYMHLREAALVETGDKVLTGQPIGEVGDTGDADGCHLHFEIWVAPGWYSGGHPIDPLPALTAWDR